MFWQLEGHVSDSLVVNTKVFSGYGTQIYEANDKNQRKLSRLILGFKVDQQVETVTCPNVRTLIVKTTFRQTRGGTSLNFSSPSLARASITEPELSQTLLI